MKNFNIDRSQSILFHPGQSAELHMGKKLIARYGKIHPVVLDNFPKLSNTFGLEFFYAKGSREFISKVKGKKNSRGCDCYKWPWWYEFCDFSWKLLL